MDLRLLFSPITPLNNTKHAGPKLADYVYANENHLPDWKSAKIALFSVAGNNDQFATAIRNEFYSLHTGYTNKLIVDLGILNKGVTYEETINRLSEVCIALLDKNVIPLILGETHGLDFGQYMAYETMEKNVNLLVADSKIDLNTLGDHNDSHLQSIILHEPNFLFNYAHIGYQSYLNPPEYIETLEKLNFDGLRLGEIATDIKKVEPSVRFADLISFDLAAIKHNTAPGKADSYPFGFTAEQACQIAWYAGFSNSCSSFGIYSFDPELDERNQTAKVVATMLWYFIEGHSERENNHDFESNNYTKFLVSTNDHSDLTFYKSKLNEFWWMKVGENVVPCSYSDYLLASTGEYPEPYDRYLAKYS